MRVSTVLLALAAGIVSASPVRRANYAVKESFLPRSWSKVERAPEDHVLYLQIGLKQNDYAGLERTLLEVSDPDHSRYGQHLSKAAVDEYTKPAADTLDYVREWLAEHDILEWTSSSSSNWISVPLSVKQVERLLDTEYHIFEHADGSRLVRTDSWSLPKHLHDHISTIQPTNTFFRSMPQVNIAERSNDLMPVGDLKGPPFAWPGAPSGHPGGPPSFPGRPPVFPGAPPPYMPANPNISAVCNFSLVTPTCLRTLYGTINYTPKSAGVNKIGMNNYLMEVSNRSDVRTFLQNYRPEAVAAADEFQFVSVANGTVSQAVQHERRGIEGNLDAETILGISWPTPMTVYSTGGSPPFTPDINTPTNTNEPYLVWLQYILSQPDSAIPQTISTSYGDDEQSVPLSYAQAVCAEIAQLGARGVTYFESSGDSGVGPTGACLSNDGKNTTMFLPAFPASCPWVSSVGGTQGFPETTVQRFGSGAGFSNYFPRPAYQDKTVSAYIDSLGATYAGLYNRTGRGYPDLSAQADFFAVIWNGTLLRVGGTSASSPAVAGIWSLVNDALITAGRPPMGFINPWLYSRGYTAFTDVTNGSSFGCGTAGFPAQQGWDAATGVGTPNFGKILSLLGLGGRPGFGGGPSSSGGPGSWKPPFGGH